MSELFVIERGSEQPEKPNAVLARFVLYSHRMPLCPIFMAYFWTKFINRIFNKNNFLLLIEKASFLFYN